MKSHIENYSFNIFVMVLYSLSLATSIGNLPSLLFIYLLAPLMSSLLTILVLPYETANIKGVFPSTSFVSRVVSSSFESI